MVERGGVAAPDRPLLQVEGLRAAYGPRVVLEDVTFTVYPGQRVAVVGPNGAGKSTLFKCIAGLVRPSAGRIVLTAPDGARAVRLAYTPQQESVNWHYPATVWDVVMMGRYPYLGLWRRPGPQDRQAVREALRQVGLEHLARWPIHRLSGGQQQRVFLARALAQQAPLLLLDEPFNAVEEGAQETVVQALSALRERGVALLMSTHDLDFVAGSHWFDRVLVLHGRVLAFGPPEAVCTRDGDVPLPSAVRSSPSGRWERWREPVPWEGRAAG